MQQEYFDKIVERYLSFCARHDKNLDAAMASLPTGPSSDATRNPPISGRPATAAKGPNNPSPGPSAATELSNLLLALRKLREAVISSDSRTPVDFSQRVYVFSVRVAILAQHPPSYVPSLHHLIDTLHKSSYPLPESELREFITYLILDYACREDNMIAAFELRARARRLYGFQSKTVDRLLSALLQDNWVVFWKVRNGVDSYMRNVINWAGDRVRRQALKAVGSAYLNVEASWVLEGCTGEKDWTWERLVETEKIGWEKEGEKIIIKRPKRKPEKKLDPITESAKP